MQHHSADRTTEVRGHEVVRRKPLRRLARDERGMSFVFVGLGLTAFLAATTLAIDVGMFMNARTQAQNSADAGALAGVTTLYFVNWDNRSSSGPAVSSAIDAAKHNKVMFEEVSVNPSDVTFPVGPTGASNQVRVDVFRTQVRNNAVDTLMGSLFGVKKVDIAATATAEATPANGMTCVKPFMIPDKWEERQTPPWDSADTFEAFDKKGNLLPEAERDWYVGTRSCLKCKDNPAYTGYTVEKDRGTRLVLRAGTGGNITPSFYYSWKMPGEIGADFYEENIANCNQSVVTVFDPMIQEPGNMVGPTIAGIERLIAKDPTATWDTGCKCVRSTYPGQSPRVFPIPLYNPMYYAEGKAHGRDADFRVANFLGFFVEYISGNEIWGYITTVTGIVVPNGTTAPAGMFPVAIRLVQ